MAIIENSRDAIFTWNADGQIERWNASAEQMFGYPADAIIGKSILTLIPPDRHEAARELIASVRRGAWYGQFESERLRRDGTLFPVELTVSPLSDRQGRVFGATTVCRDITDRKRAQEMLTRRMRELAALYELTDRLQRTNSMNEICDAALDAILSGLACRRASILLFDASGVMRFVAWRGLSDEYRKVVDGHSPWSVDTTQPAPIWVEDARETDNPESLKSALEAERIRALAFIPLVADGSLIGKFMIYHEEPHSFSSEETRLAVNIARQLGFALQRQRAEDARRAAERDSRESEQRLAFALSAGRMGAWEWHINTGKVVWSSGLEALHGIAPGTFTGNFDTFSSEIHPDDREAVLANVSEAAKGTRDYHTIYRSVGADREQRWFEAFGRVAVREDDRPKVLAGVCMDVTERMRAQERQETLINELNHRVKNTLATVQAIAHQTLRSHAVDESVRRTLEQRLIALSDAHGLLTQQNWEGAQLGEIVAHALKPHADPERIFIQGPTVRLTPKMALAIAMAMHELATNAAKYGALSNDAGRITVAWKLDGASSSPHLGIEWRESDGPKVIAPLHRGFGSRLIERNLAYDIDGEARLEFAEDGLICNIACPLPTRTSNRPGEWI